MWKICMYLLGNCYQIYFKLFITYYVWAVYFFFLEATHYDYISSFIAYIA